MKFKSMDTDITECLNNGSRQELTCGSSLICTEDVAIVNISMRTVKGQKKSEMALVNEENTHIKFAKSYTKRLPKE